MFSKVSHSLALVNSVSTLLNKGGIACRRPTASQDFLCFSKTNTNSHSLCSSLVPHDTSEARVGGNSCTQSFRAHALLHGCSQASSSASKLIPCQRKLPQHAKTCQNMPPQFMLVNKPVKNSVHAKVSSKEVRNLTVGCAEHWPTNQRHFKASQCPLLAYSIAVAQNVFIRDLKIEKMNASRHDEWPREPKGKQQESYFHTSQNNKKTLLSTHKKQQVQAAKLNKPFNEVLPDCHRGPG